MALAVRTMTGAPALTLERVPPQQQAAERSTERGPVAPRSGDAAFRANSTAFLRLCAALAVIAAHNLLLGGWGGDDRLPFMAPYFSLGQAAVFVFFCLSGLLISQSVAGCSSVWRYAWHRAVRIVPGYWTCLVVCAFGFGPLLYALEGGTVARYGVLHAERFITANLWALRQSGIAPLLAHTPRPSSLDNSLWTIHYEVLCYAGLGALGLCGVLRRGPVLMLTATIYALTTALHARGAAPLVWETWDAALAFMLGACLYQCRAALAVRLNRRYTLIALATLLCGLHVNGGYMVTPLALTYLIYAAAYRLPVWTRRIGAGPDLSYGLYLYAWPVAQTLALVHVNDAGYLSYTAATLACTLGLAALSWRYVERPALRLKGAAWPHAALRGRRAGRGALGRAS